MARYADIDKAINLLKDTYKIVNPNYNFMVMSADALFENILDNAEVEAEPIKHGRWIESWGGKWHSCSVCGGIPPFNFKGEDLPTDYCPHCGAKMDEVENG